MAPVIRYRLIMGKNIFTDFQLRVLLQAAKIPFGEVRTYRWVAKKIGAPKAVRAVGTALKKNPYPLIIPCHRVIKSSGELGEYAGGKNIKKALIVFERALKAKKAVA